MENCEVVRFFNAVGDSKVTLESILRCCVLDEMLVKDLEGLSATVDDTVIRSAVI